MNSPIHPNQQVIKQLLSPKNEINLCTELLDFRIKQPGNIDMALKKKINTSSLKLNISYCFIYVGYRKSEVFKKS